MVKLFMPKHKWNMQTDFCCKLTADAAVTISTKMEDTCFYLLHSEGENCQAIIPAGEEPASFSIGMHANNDPLEETFATLTYIFCIDWYINLSM